MKDRTNKSFWQSYSKVYTQVMSANNKTYDAVCKELSKYIDKNKNVLELACGTGQLSFRMAGKAGTWIATDYSDNMIKEAQKRNVDGKVSFAVADATNLTYKDESFDAVVIANALHIMPDPDKALAEIRRVLKKDGILFCPTFVYKSKKSNLIIKVMEKLGFKSYNKWTVEEFTEYVKSKSFKLINTSVIKAIPLLECVWVGKK